MASDGQVVLVVDDDPRTQRLLQQVLQANGFRVVVGSDGDVVVGLVRRERPDAIVLDLKMPRLSGFEALRALRRAGEEVPVLILTGVFDEDWVLEAFAAGADDYVTKPFQPRVLVARIRAILRRHQRALMQEASIPAEPDADVWLDARTRHAHVLGRAVPLSPTEFQLLRTLMRDGGTVFTATELLSRVWGPEYVGQDDIVRANIYRLRRKLEPVPDEPRYILGRRGVGYYFSSPARATA